MSLIIEYQVLFLIIGASLGLFMTWAIGSKDVANTMGTAVGSGGISIKQAIIIAIVFEFLGVVLAGSQVTNTIQNDIIDSSSVLAKSEVLVFGMMAVILAASLWIMVASRYGWPMSITHTVIGAMVGFGVVGVGVAAINWFMLAKFFVSWVISPLLSGLVGLILMEVIHKLILKKNPVGRAIKYTYPLVFIVGFSVSFITFFRGIAIIKLEISVWGTVLLATVFGLFLAKICQHWIGKIVLDDYQEHDLQLSNVEIVFGPLMILAACALAFSHGANDVASSMGPIALLVQIIQHRGDLQSIPTDVAGVPVWILVLGGFGILLGMVTLGYRVMQTIGRKITELTPTSGFCATIATALTVILATRIGLPVSTAQIAIGAVVGVGMSRGMDVADFRVVQGIYVTWLITIPASMIISAVFYLMLSGMLGSQLQPFLT